MSTAFKEAIARKVERRRKQLKKERMVASKLPKDNWTEETRERLLSKVNEAEQHVDALLRSLPVTFKRERPIVANGKRYFIDFLVISIMGKDRERIRVAIEVDGGYHNTAEQRAKDKEKDRNLLTSFRVWAILRITAEKALTMTADDLMACLKAAPVGETTHLNAHNDMRVLYLCKPEPNFRLV